MPGRRGRRGELVEAVVAVEPPGSVDTEHGEGTDDTLGHRRVGHADGAAGRPGRVRQGSEEVEGGGDAELSAGGRGVTERGVEARREAEPDAGVGDAAGDAGRSEGDRDAPRFAGVRRSAP